MSEREDEGMDDVPRSWGQRFRGAHIHREEGGCCDRADYLSEDSSEPECSPPGGTCKIYLVGGPYNGQALDVPESMMKRGAIEMAWPDEVPPVEFQDPGVPGAIRAQPTRRPALYLRAHGAWTVFQFQEPPRRTWHDSAATV